MNTATRSTYAKLQMASAHMERGRGKARYTHTRRDHHRELLVAWWGRPAWGGNPGVRYCLRLFYRNKFAV